MIDPIAIPTDPTKPFPKWVSRLNAEGRVARKDYMIQEGIPGLCCFGYASASYEYDDRGRQTKVAFFGLDGAPCRCFDSFTGMTFLNDDVGNVIKTVYLGTKNEPCLNGSKVAGWLAEYDSLGRNSKLSFIDSEDRPCVDSRGVAGWNCSFVEGTGYTVSYFDLEGHETHQESVVEQDASQTISTQPAVNMALQKPISKHPSE